jgi:fused signal recognition particle receptor
MFEGLKKKFSNFVDSLSKKEEKELQKASSEPEPPNELGQEKIANVAEQNAHQWEALGRDISNIEAAKPVHKEAREAKQIHQEQQKAEKKAVTEEAIKAPTHPEPEKEQARDSVSEEPQKEAKVTRPKEERRDEKPSQKAADTVQAKAPSVSAVTKIKGLFLGHVRISESDVNPFIENLQMGLLQSDVNYDVAEKVANNIRHVLVGKEVNSRNIEGDIRQGIRESIFGVLAGSSGIDIVERINKKRSENALPYKILFVGPNGAGKTTTMAKIANMMLENSITCVLSASDTFRAAAIEQTAYHASRLGISVIKGTYGADPASVAFDAIAHAKAHGIMAVLIDSAGRQETNKSLIEELKKMTRVTRPDLKIFIGESISGNALLAQVKAINDAIGLDGIILTKLDVDAKGGNTLSILGDTTIPVLYFGTGEGYSDIMPYDPKFIVDNILPNN